MLDINLCVSVIYRSHHIQSFEISEKRKLYHNDSVRLDMVQQFLKRTPPLAVLPPINKGVKSSSGSIEAIKKKKGEIPTNSYDDSKLLGEIVHSTKS